MKLLEERILKDAAVRAGNVLKVDSFLNHQMDVQAFVRRLADGFQHRESKRDVGHEHAVHHVDVYPLGRAAVDHLDIVSELSEVGRQNRRSYDTFHN